MQVSDTDSKWLNPLRHGGFDTPIPLDHAHRPALELTRFKAVPDLRQWQFLAKPCQASTCTCLASKLICDHWNFSRVPPVLRQFFLLSVWSRYDWENCIYFLSQSPKTYFPIHAPFMLRGSWSLFTAVSLCPQETASCRRAWRYPFLIRLLSRFFSKEHPSMYSFQQTLGNGETLRQCRRNDRFQLLTFCYYSSLFHSVSKFIGLTSSEISSSEISSGGTEVSVMSESWLARIIALFR